MPSPRQYVAIVVTWLVLMFVAGINESTARATKAIGWALVLTGIVIGPFGQRTVSLFNSIATTFGTPPTSSTSNPNAAASVPGVAAIGGSQ